MADVVLKDRYGKNVEYPGVERIKVNTVDGGVQEYIDSSTVPEPEETTVALDFSMGDMEVVPDVGMLFSKVIIPVPKNLIPENIAKDVNIAEIIGSHTSAKFSCGIDGQLLNIRTIQHNLGVVPDLICIWPYGVNPSYNDKIHLICSIAMQLKLKEAIGSPYSVMSIIIRWNSSTKQPDLVGCPSFSTTGLEGTTIFSNVNENSFTVGTDTRLLLERTQYVWLAIAGLT